MQEKIREVLSGVIDPNTGKDLVSSKALKKVTTEDGKTTVQIELDYPAKTQALNWSKPASPPMSKSAKTSSLTKYREALKFLTLSATSLPSPAARAA